MSEASTHFLPLIHSIPNCTDEIWVDRNLGLQWNISTYTFLLNPVTVFNEIASDSTPIPSNTLPSLMVCSTPVDNIGGYLQHYSLFEKFLFNIISSFITSIFFFFLLLFCSLVCTVNHTYSGEKKWALLVWWPLPPATICVIAPSYTCACHM